MKTQKTTSNPIFKEVQKSTKTFNAVEVKAVSRNGVFSKTLLGVLVFFGTMIFAMQNPTIMQMTSSILFMIMSTIVIIYLTIQVAKNPEKAKVVFYGYAIIEGLWMSSFVYVMNSYTGSNVGFQAAGIVFIIFVMMLFIYEAYPNFFNKIAPAYTVVMFGVFAILMVNFFMSLFGAGISFGSTFDVILTLVLAIMASLTYLRDFQTVDLMVQNKLPKSYEYVAALGLLSTTIWLYIEIVRLLAIFSKRD